MAKIKAPTWTADQFTPTKFTTAKQKADFANKLARFALNGFKRGSFSKPFYRTLSNCFGHIAHFDQGGFYGTWFSCTRDQLDWVHHIINSHHHDDVEREVRAWLLGPGYDLREQLASKVADDTRRAELARLAELQAQYPEAACG